MKIPIEISARHIHLSQKDLDVLFGENYALQKEKDLSQPGQFASKETITIEGPKATIERVRIIAPVRAQTQLEISITDSYALGVSITKPNLSGDLDDSVGDIKIIGPAGEVKLDKGVIVAKRHLHIEPELAKKLNIRYGDEISIETYGDRSIIFNNVIVRSTENVDALSFQLDTDEANAAGIKNGDLGELI